MLPALAKAKGKSHRISCLSNIKQLNICWASYAQDHNGLLAESYFAMNSGGVNTNAWVIVLFARQVSEASEASTRADEMRVHNEALAADVIALEDELALIQRQAYIEQQAREYRLGAPRERPFILADDAPPLASDAPGTAATRLGANLDDETPLESWLDLLFGESVDPAVRMNRPVPSEPPTPEPSF